MPGGGDRITRNGQKLGTAERNSTNKKSNLCNLRNLWMISMSTDENRAGGPTFSAAAKLPGCDRRTFLTGASAALAAIALARPRAQAQDLQKLAAAKQDQSATDPGPENRILRDANPGSFLPPVTDHGEVQSFWNSFSEELRPGRQR